jgi:protease-4
MRVPALIPLLAAACFITTPAAEPKKAEPSSDGTLVVDLDGKFPLRPTGGLLFGGHDQSLFDATMALREALQAPEKRVVLDLTYGFNPGLAAAEELAAVLRAYKATNTGAAAKKISCLVDGLDDAAMVVARACDEVVVAEAGLIEVKGLAGGVDYYADALAKIGVKFHAVTSGPAKTAPEPLTRATPSDAAKAELQHLIKRLDQTLTADLTSDHFSAAELTTARARSPQTAAIAVETGLAARSAEPGAWLRNLPAPVRKYKPHEREHDFDSLPGLMAALSELINGEPETKHPQAVAVVELEGDILDGDGGVPGMAITGTDTAALFDRLAEDRRIVAVVVRVNSPGGSADASDRIHFAIRRCVARKPVVALFDGVAASGGYYFGCAAQEILVHRGTITGSIGVFALVPDLAETKRLLGINHFSITTGPRANLFDLDGFSPEKEAALGQIISAVDKRFQGLVAERRKLPPEVVKELAGGRVFTGEEAIERGLADKLGDLPSAVQRARELAHKPDPLPLERYPKAGGLAARLGLTSTLALEQAGLTAAPLRWAAQARTGKPLVLCWSMVPGL